MHEAHYYNKHGSVGGFFLFTVVADGYLNFCLGWFLAYHFLGSNSNVKGRGQILPDAPDQEDFLGLV